MNSKIFRLGITLFFLLTMSFAASAEMAGQSVDQDMRVRSSLKQPAHVQQDKKSREGASAHRQNKQLLVLFLLLSHKG